MKKISSSQLIALLFVTRAFLSTTYGGSQYQLNVVLSMASAFVSIIIQLLLIIPPVLLLKNSDSTDFLKVAYSRSRWLGMFLSFLYGGFFCFEAIRLLGIFSYFLKNQFVEYLPAPLLIIALSLVAIYGAKCGIEGLARTSTVAVFMFLVMFFVIIFSVTGETDILNIQLATPVPKNTLEAFMGDVLLKTAASDELVAVVFLLPFVRKNGGRATFIYMGIKLFVTEVMIFYSALILGEYANGLSQPFYTLSTYARTSIIERYDSIYMCVWTVGTVIKCAVLFYLLSKALNGLRIKHSCFFGWAVPTVTATAVAFNGNYDADIFKAPSVLAVTVLCGLIPLLLMIRGKKGEKE